MVNNLDGCDGIGSSIVHVLPTYGREHVTDGDEDCWCEPELEVEDGGGIVVVHRDMN